jgi:hypothetical protein
MERGSTKVFRVSQARFTHAQISDSSWNRRAFPDDGQEEEVREGFDPDNPEPHNPEQARNLDSPFAVGDGEDEASSERAPPVSEEAQRWEHREYDRGSGEEEEERRSLHYGSFHEERNAWGSNDAG